MTCVVNNLYFVFENEKTESVEKVFFIFIEQVTRIGEVSQNVAADRTRLYMEWTRRIRRIRHNDGVVESNKVFQFRFNVSWKLYTTRVCLPTQKPTRSCGRFVNTSTDVQRRAVCLSLQTTTIDYKRTDE